MPRQSKKTINAGAAASKQKGVASGTKKTPKSSADVGELLQTLNSNHKTPGTSSQPRSSDQETRQTGRGRRKTSASRGRVGEGDGASDNQRSRPQTAITGGRGRGRRRVSGRADDEVTNNAQIDERMGKGKGTKRRQKEATTASTRNTPTKHRRYQGQRELFAEDDFQERQISAQSVAKWQAMTKTSQEFLNQIAESAISIVLNETSSSSYSGVQDHLNNLKRRLMTSFVSLKVPSKKHPNYKDVETLTGVLEAALVETSNQVECLDKEVDLQQQLLEQKEEEVERLEAAEQDNEKNSPDIAKKLHPLLQDEWQDKLGLPPLRRRHNQCTNRQFEDVGSSCQQHILESLRHWSQRQGEEATKMTEFMDAVSSIHAALPR